MTNAHNKMGQMAVCCQYLTLGALTSCSTLFVLVYMLFKKFDLFLNTPCIATQDCTAQPGEAQLTMLQCTINQFNILRDTLYKHAEQVFTKQCNQFSHHLLFFDYPEEGGCKFH
jgi:hypothetical protein